MANEFKVKKGLIVDGSNTVLDIQGAQGQLFSVTDSLTGDLFSVSDISGIPILNVNSSGVVSIEGAQVPTGTGTANKLTKWNSAGTGLEDTNISVAVSGTTRKYTINGGQTGSGIDLLTLNKNTGGASDRSIMFRIGTTQNDIVSDANSDTGELRFRLPIADGTESSILVLNSNGNISAPGYSTGYLKTDSNGAITADNSTFLTSSSTQTKYLRSDIADEATERITFRGDDTNSNDTIATSTGSLGSVEIFNNGSGVDAFMAFHVGGDYACYFGLDGGTNKLSVGGWSMGANSYEIYHSGNKPSLSALGAQAAGTYSTATGVADNADVTPSWVPSSDPSYLTSSSTQSKYIRSDADDTVTGHTEWQDNKQVRLGNGSDMRLYHNATDSYIDNHAGHLYIRNNATTDLGFNVYIQAKSGENSLKANDDGSVVLYYNNSTKFATASGGVDVTGTLYASGNIGNLGTGVGQQFELGSTAVSTLRCDADRWRVYMGGNSNGYETLTVTETGLVGIKNSSPTYKLDVNGAVSGISIYASHDIAAYSDKRVKKDIETIPNALDKVSKLRGVTFKRTDEGSSDRTHMGVIAQEVQEVVPEVVTMRESDGHLSVAYANMVGLLIESVKDLKAEIDELKKCGKCDNCNCKNK